MAHAVGVRWLHPHEQVVLETSGELLGGAYSTNTDVDDAIHVGGGSSWGGTCFVQVQVHHEAAREHPPR